MSPFEQLLAYVLLTLAGLWSARFIGRWADSHGRREAPRLAPTIVAFLSRVRLHE